MGSQKLNQIGVKRKAPGDDKLQPDKYQCTDAKIPVAQRVDNREKTMYSQTLPHTGLEQVMVEVKSEEASKGALSNPTEAQKTGNTKAKIWTCNFTIRILNCFYYAVEDNKARTKAKMVVRPEVKARGDTIEESLEEPIEAAGSSSK
uniref:Uncharacterized protein n=1 Tax=Romanomermis culicivorax TaxID=13658 RepID=A0A915K1E9_ROMCU